MYKISFLNERKVSAVNIVSEFVQSGNMFKLKTVLVLVTFFATCYGQHDMGGFYEKKKHHHHHYGMHHFHYLYYLTFLAIKLKILFFLGTIFTISMVAGKVIAIIKLTEYMKKKDDHHHHEEKIVYVNPHEHHEFGGEPWAKSYPSSGSGYPSEYPGDQPPPEMYDHHERYGTAPGSYPGTGRNGDDSFSGKIYHGLMTVSNRLRQLNITEMALNEMGVKDENCKKKFVCKADVNARGSVILRTGFNVLRDASYQKLMPHSDVASEEDCDALYPQCTS